MNTARHAEEALLKRRKSETGFTMIELMIVMAIMAVLTTLAVMSYTVAVKHAKEAVLREDLQVMRTAIQSYTMDKEKAPQSLDDLVQSGYLRSIPVDPMTQSSDSWVTGTSQDMYSLDETDPGVNDVHSGSNETGSNGQAYSSW